MNIEIVRTQQPNRVNKLEIREVNALSNVLSRALHNEPHLASKPSTRTDCGFTKTTASASREPGRFQVVARPSGP